MQSILVRFVILAAVFVVLAVALRLGRRFVESRRRLALAAEPFAPPQGAEVPVRILAFSSDDCAQCHRLQAPALERVLAARPGGVAVQEIDAPATPELTSRYNILTVPSTVVLDADGRAHAVNYGFANTAKLLRQVDAVRGDAVPQSA